MADTDPVENPNVYRAISKRRWYVPAERRVLSIAFIRRPTEEGLSLLKRVDGCSRENCLSNLNRCFGEFILRTEQILALGLKLREDEPGDVDFNPNHTEIRGLPPPQDEKAAEDAATPLAQMARVHYDRHGKF
jgi:hypothetical protein